jgi:catechol 2,3-dioxygenase-like lactoylglutathione lyase family enzyme
MAIQLKSAYLTIPVSNLHRSVAWYGEHFGFKVVKEDSLYLELVNETGVRVLLQENEHKLNSHYTFPNGALQSSYGFIVPDAETAYNYLIDKGVKVGKFYPDYQGKSFSFYDPDGNFIEIWSFPETR